MTFTRNIPGYLEETWNAMEAEILRLRAQLAEARDAALEEAAAVCDGLVSHADTLAKGEVSIILGVCGDRIRAMKNQKP